MEPQPKERYASSASKTEDGAIANLLRVRARGQGHTTIYSYICDHCGEIAWSHRTNVRCCSVQCQIDIKPKFGFGDKHPRWKGGKYIDDRGYVLLSGKWDHPRCHPTRGTLQEHRVVMENHLGRILRKGENVHHKNGIKHDNRIENLELWAVPQPYGQRVIDLIEWVVNNYPSEVKAKLEVKEIVNDAIRNEAIV